MAEREGFEPSRSFGPLHTFQACAFDHSATAPCRGLLATSERFRKLSRYGRLPECVDPSCRPPFSPFC